MASTPKQQLHLMSSLAESSNLSICPALGCHAGCICEGQRILRGTEAGKVEICRVSSGSCGGRTTCLPSLLCSVSHTRHFPSVENKRQEGGNEYGVTLPSRRATVAFRSMTIYLGHMSEGIIAFSCNQIHYCWFDLICLPFPHLSCDHWDSSRNIYLNVKELLCA